MTTASTAAPLCAPSGAPAIPLTCTGAMASTVAPSHYVHCLTCCFGLFSLARVIAYLPTMWTIGASGDSSQYSLLTWLAWLGANVTMAAYLYEQGGRRGSWVVALNICNAAMCLLTVAVITAHRI